MMTDAPSVQAGSLLPLLVGRLAGSGSSHATLMSGQEVSERPQAAATVAVQSFTEIGD